MVVAALRPPTRAAPPAAVGPPIVAAYSGLGLSRRRPDSRRNAGEAAPESKRSGSRASTSGLGHGQQARQGRLEEHGKVRQAEAAYRRADQRDDAEAAFNLGALLYERGALERRPTPTSGLISAATVPRLRISA